MLYLEELSPTGLVFHGTVKKRSNLNPASPAAHEACKERMARMDALPRSLRRLVQEGAKPAHSLTKIYGVYLALGEARTLAWAAACPEFHIGEVSASPFHGGTVMRFARAPAPESFAKRAVKHTLTLDDL